MAKAQRPAVFFLVVTSTVFEELFRLARHLLAHDIEPVFHFTFDHWNVEPDSERCRNAGIRVLRNDEIRGSTMSRALARVRLSLCGRLLQWRATRFLGEVLTETIDLWQSGACAAEYLSVSGAQLLVLSCDLVGYDSSAWVKAAQRRGTKALIVSSIMSNGLDVAEANLHNPRFQVAGVWGKVIVWLFPRWLLAWRGTALIRAEPRRILAMEMLGLAPPLPWLFNSSRADAVTMESAAMADYYAAAGMAREQMRVVGSTADDVLAETLAHREARRSELCRVLGLPADRPIILTALPPDFLYFDGGRPECDFRDYASLVEFWIRALAAVKDHSVVICMHPSARADDMRHLERHGARISALTTPELVPLCDFFVASISSTIRWAIACGKPVLNYDVYRYRYVDDFGKVGGVLTVEEQRDFLAALDRLAQDKDYAREMSEKQRALSQRWSFLDGKCGARMVALVQELLPAAAPQPVTGAIQSRP